MSRRHLPMPLPGEERRRPEPVVVVRARVEPEVWATALRLAGGDDRRIQRESEQTVIILNHRWR